jgi:hypothetical protein
VFLLGAAFLAGLGEAGREQRHAANLARNAATDRIRDGGFRHDQHGRIDARRQIGDGRHAASAVDLGNAARHETDLAGKADRFEIGEDSRARRSRVGRGADDRD